MPAWPLPLNDSDRSRLEDRWDRRAPGV